MRFVLPIVIASLSTSTFAHSPDVEYFDLDGRVMQVEVERSRIYVSTDRAFHVIDRALGKVVAEQRFENGKAVFFSRFDGGAYLLVANDLEERTLVEVALKDASIVRRKELPSHAARNLKVIDDQRLALIGHPVLILKREDLSIEAKIEIPDGVANDADIHQGKILVARSYAGGVVIIDPEKGAIEKVIPVEPWLHRVRVVGGRTFVIGMGQFGWVDLEKSEFHQLHRVGIHALEAVEEAALVQGRSELRLVDAQGKIAKKLTLAEELLKKRAVIMTSTDKEFFFAAGKAVAIWAPGRPSKQGGDERAGLSGPGGE